MKLVCLNVWGGRKFEALKNFMEKMSPKTDIFCFQEIYDSGKSGVSDSGIHSGLFREFGKLLPDFNSSFAPIVFERKAGGTDETDVFMGSALFWRKGIHPRKEGSFFAFGSLSERTNYEPHRSGLLQHATFEVDGSPLVVSNFHGIATWPKNDSTARLEQSEKILEFLNGVGGPKILCGDFNLFPDTKSIAVLKHVMKSLTDEFGIETTRSRLHFENFKGEAIPDTISDYMFVSPEVRVDSFSVPDIEISDHLPLVLDFSL